MVIFMVHSLWKPSHSGLLSPFSITGRKSPANPQRTMDPTTGTNCQTQIPSYLTLAYWLFPNSAKERIQDSYTFCPVSLSPDYKPWLYDPLDSRWRGDRLLEAGPYRVLPSAGLMIKAIFLCPPNSVSTIFIQLWWTKKTKILVVTVASLCGDQVGTTGSLPSVHQGPERKSVAVSVDAGSQQVLPREWNCLWSS